ncbi:hypothetical protein AMTRI_Chr03g53920 [Amborella trichopoda]|nr:AMP deaminase isoform X2 [Amborella trichopoda]|eukprot:XP_006838792.2 AMP deaminase isoform X2 [Amborella trichopoda]
MENHNPFPSSSLQIFMAALFGASVMAISSFYFHKRAVNHILERALHFRRKAVRSRSAIDEAQREREEEEMEKEDEEGEEEDEDYDGGIGFIGGAWGSNVLRGGEREAMCYRVSSSMPDEKLLRWRGRKPSELVKGEEQRRRNMSIANGCSSSGRLDCIPDGITSLQTQGEGNNQSLNHSSPHMSFSSLLRSSTPKSQVASAFQDVEVCDNEEIPNETRENESYRYMNGNGDPSLLGTMGTYDVDTNDEDLSRISSIDFGGNSYKSNIFGTVVSNSNNINGDHCMHTPTPVAADILRKEPEKEGIPLEMALNEALSGEDKEVRLMLQECLSLRNKYVFREKIVMWEKEMMSDPSTRKPVIDPFCYKSERPSEHYFWMEDGVVHVYSDKEMSRELFPVADSTTFFTDMHHILKIMSTGSLQTACKYRLDLLEYKFRLHLLLNADREFLAQKSAPHRDFYNVRKVDTHVHHSACMNQKHLLRFIKSKLRKEPDEVVIFRDGKYLTLSEVFESLDLTGYDLSVDLLDVHADKSTFHRFDKFNLKYNPCGQSRLREIFLKQDNLIQGRFIAEVTKEVLSDLETSKFQVAEYRISIYGRKQSEWDQLASWFVNNEIYSENAIWLIQLPRLYNVYKDMGIVTSFQNILDNVFIPLFEVTVNPSSHPELHVFLRQVVGFDIVDDESKPERRPTKHMPTPAQWTNNFNPAFSYYAYYCYANLYTLNKLRESKGMSLIKFRPHCGEAGDIDHLAAAFLAAHNIAHGNNLRKSTPLQYLYYLSQIGLAMSPLSNNSLFLDYRRNPFPMFFARGLNVSLSTDDPLQIHLTKEPLVEEYSVAAQVWKLGSCDLCEIARNSVYQSGFSHATKLHWLGNKYYKRGPAGNDIQKTNVPLMRVAFRHQIWKEEMQYVYMGRAKISEEIDA